MLHVYSSSIKTKFTPAEAKEVGSKIGIDWNSSPFNVEQFRKGLEVELEHGLQDSETNVTHGDPLMTGKIAWAHLKEYSDYYDRLEEVET